MRYCFSFLNDLFGLIFVLAFPVINLFVVFCFENLYVYQYIIVYIAHIFFREAPYNHNVGIVNATS